MTTTTRVGDYTTADLARWATNPFNERHEQGGTIVTLVDGDLEDHRPVIRFYDRPTPTPQIGVEVYTFGAWSWFQSIETDRVDIDVAAGIVYLAIRFANTADALSSVNTADAPVIEEPARNVPIPD